MYSNQISLRREFHDIGMWFNGLRRLRHLLEYEGPMVLTDV